MPKELPRDEVRCTATARSGERCQTPRMPDRDVCFRHSLNGEPAADLAKKAGRTSARVRQTPARVRRLRRRTMKERIASPDAPSRVEVEEGGEVIETRLPAWRIEPGKPVGTRALAGDSFRVVGCYWPSEAPGGEPVYRPCERGCTNVCAVLAEQPAERQRTVEPDDASTPPSRGEAVDWRVGVDWRTTLTA
jgi:hypothetical protein